MFGQYNVTPFTAISACVIFTVGTWLFKILYTGYNSPLRTVPGPWHTRFTNLGLKKATTGGRRVYYIEELHHQYGPVVRISPNEVAVADVEAFKQIHSVTSKFEKSEWYANFTSFPRLGVFTMRNLKDHYVRRKAVAKGLSKSFLREHWESMVRENSEMAVQKIRKDALNGEADLLEWLTFLALDVVGHLGFGESFGMVERGERTEYIRVLEKARVGNGIGAELPWVREIGKRLPMQAAKETFKASAYILDYAKRAIQIAQVDNGEKNYVATLRSEAEKQGARLDDIDVQIESTNLIFAGSGTVSLTLTFLAYAVLSHPSIQARLEEEVSTLPANFKDADAEKLPYMNAVIEETLRLYCAVPGTLPRVVPQGGISISDHYIPEGAIVSTQAWTFHRDPSLFVDPHTFDPSRWLPDRVMSAAAKAAFCPFGAGASSCLGVHLARMEMRYTVAMLFRECRGMRLSASTTAASMEPINFFVITPKGHKCEVTLKA